ncbi:FeoB-associated Cys-rich membrane protein [Enterococcus italicus]
MATIILAVLIFATAAYIVYRQVTGKSQHCEQCNCSCPAKDAQALNKAK